MTLLLADIPAMPAPARTVPDFDIIVDNADAALGFAESLQAFLGSLPPIQVTGKTTPEIKLPESKVETSGGQVEARIHNTNASPADAPTVRFHLPTITEPEETLLPDVRIYASASTKFPESIPALGPHEAPDQARKAVGFRQRAEIERPGVSTDAPTQTSPLAPRVMSGMPEQNLPGAEAITRPTSRLVVSNIGPHAASETSQVLPEAEGEVEWTPSAKNTGPTESNQIPAAQEDPARADGDRRARHEPLLPARNATTHLREAVKPFVREADNLTVVKRVDPVTIRALEQPEPEPSTQSVPRSIEEPGRPMEFAKAFFRPEHTSESHGYRQKQEQTPKPTGAVVNHQPPVGGEWSDDEPGAPINGTPEESKVAAESTRPNKSQAPSAKADRSQVDADIPPRHGEGAQSSQTATADGSQSRGEAGAAPKTHQPTIVQTGSEQPMSNAVPAHESEPTLRYEIERPRDSRLPAQIRVRVTPPDLGKVRIDLTSTPRGVIGTLRFESEQAREIVGRDLGNLRRTLADAGIRVDRLDVPGVASTEPRTTFQQGGGEHQPGSQSFARGQSHGGRYQEPFRQTDHHQQPALPSSDPGASAWMTATGWATQVNVVA